MGPSSASQPSPQGPEGVGRTYVRWYLPNHVGSQQTEVDALLLPVFLTTVLALGATIMEVR